MAETKKNDPQFKPSVLGLDSVVHLTLKSAKAIKKGESKFGAWSLWLVDVVNAPVEDKETKVVTKSYTGPATWFPSQVQEEKLLALTKGTQENVKISLTVKAGKNDKGMYTVYDIALVEGGTTPPSNLSYSSHRFLETYSKFLETYKSLTGHGLLSDGKETFLKLATSSANKIPLSDAEKLWDVFNENK